jgi:hypothetical protein
MLGQREVVVVISVDEPELDAVTRARSIDGREEPRPVGMVREVAEVADLEHDRAVLLGRRADEPLDPRRVAVGVAGHEHATNIVSWSDRSVHATSVATETFRPWTSFGWRAGYAAKMKRLLRKCVDSPKAVDGSGSPRSADVAL